jgi:hypothetical protein
MGLHLTPALCARDPQLGFEGGVAYGMRSIGTRWGFEKGKDEQRGWLYSPMCFGNEPSLSQCRRSNPWGDAYCGAKWDMAGVWCTEKMGDGSSNINAAGRLNDTGVPAFAPTGFAKGEGRFFTTSFPGGLYELVPNGPDSINVRVLSDPAVVSGAAGVTYWRGKLFFLGQSDAQANNGESSLFSLDLATEAVEEHWTGPQAEGFDGFHALGDYLYTRPFMGSALIRFNGTDFETVFDGPGGVAAMTVFRGEVYFATGALQQEALWIAAYSEQTGEVRYVSQQAAGLQDWSDVLALIPEEGEEGGESLFIVGRRHAITGREAGNGVFRWVPGQFVEHVAEVLVDSSGIHPGASFGVAAHGGLLLAGHYFGLTDDDNDFNFGQSRRLQGGLIPALPVGDRPVSEGDHAGRAFLFYIRQGLNTLEFTDGATEPLPFFLHDEDGSVYFFAHNEETGVQVYATSLPEGDNGMPPPPPRRLSLRM